MKMIMIIEMFERMGWIGIFEMMKRWMNMGVM